MDGFAVLVITILVIAVYLLKTCCKETVSDQPLALCEPEPEPAWRLASSGQQAGPRPTGHHFGCCIHADRQRRVRSVLPGMGLRLQHGADRKARAQPDSLRGRAGRRRRGAFESYRGAFTCPGKPAQWELAIEGGELKAGGATGCNALTGSHFEVEGWVKNADGSRKQVRRKVTIVRMGKVKLFADWYLQSKDPTARFATVYEFGYGELDSPCLPGICPYAPCLESRLAGTNRAELQSFGFGPQ